MSSVTEIENAIKKLSVAEQRIIARHLDARLLKKNNSGVSAAADEGIRFLPQYQPCLAPHGARDRKLKHPAKTTR